MNFIWDLKMILYKMKNMRGAPLFEPPGPVIETNVAVSNSAIAEVRRYVSYKYVCF